MTEEVIDNTASSSHKTRVEYKGFVIESDDPKEVEEWLRQFFMTNQ